MSWSEKVQAMEELWESLSRDENRLELPTWHADVLEETRQNYAAGREQPIDAVYYKKEGHVCTVWRVLDCRQNPVKTIRALK